MAKPKWFKFYFLFGEAFKELSGRNSKKLILALVEYQDKGYSTIKLNKKTNEYFKAFKSVYMADLIQSQVNGRKGGLNSRGVPKTRHKTDRVKRGCYD